MTDQVRHKEIIILRPGILTIYDKSTVTYGHGYSKQTNIRYVLVSLESGESFCSSILSQPLYIHLPYYIEDIFVKDEFAGARKSTFFFLSHSMTSVVCLLKTYWIVLCPFFFMEDLLFPAKLE